MKRALLCSLLALFLMPCLASASLVSFTPADDPFGGPNPIPAPTGGELTGIYSGPDFDCLVWGAGTPDFMPPTVVGNFDVAGWAQSWASSSSAAAGGPATNALTATVYFADPFEVGDFFYTAFYNSGAYVAALRISSTANGISVELSDFGADGKPTPEPATWIALVAGLGVLGVVRYRMA